MTTYFRFAVFFRRFYKLMLAVVLAGFVLGGSVAQASSTTVTWKVSSLVSGEVRNLSDLVAINFSAIKTWSTQGSCVLSPASKPTKLTMGSTNSCVLTVKIARTKSHPSKSSSKTITLSRPIAYPSTIVPVSTTSTTSSTSTVVAPPNPSPTTPTTSTTSSTSTTVAPPNPPPTVTTSGNSFTPSSFSIVRGQTVSFVVNSSHNIVWQDGYPGRGTTGAAYSRSFSTVGTFSFYCSLHYEMSGSITVN